MNKKTAVCMAAAAITAAAVPASAEVYLTESQALGVVFGDKAISRREQKPLDAALRKHLEEASGLRFPETSVTFFIAVQDSKPAKYAIVMNEIGKTEPITFVVGMSPEGKVTEVVIMEFRENRGWEVKEKRFLNQFRGKTARSAIRVDEDIVNYAGATLSSKAVARGVKRALFLLEAFYPGEARFKLSAALDFALSDENRPITTIPTRAGRLGLYRQIRYAMGTHCEIRTWSFCAADARPIFEKGFNELERIEHIFSAYREDSELSGVNRHVASGNVKVSDELFAVAQAGAKAAIETHGTVNFAVGPLVDLWRRCESEDRWPANEEISNARLAADPAKLALRNSDRSLLFGRPDMRLDFGGIAKGYAADRIAAVLESSGAISALVNLGRSSIYATKVSGGWAENGERENLLARFDAWPIGILQPDEALSVAATVLLEPGEAVSTSGTAERGFIVRGERLSHILNPTTGWPVRDARSATVIGQGGIRTEVASKRLLLAARPERFHPTENDRLRYWRRLDSRYGTERS